MKVVIGIQARMKSSRLPGKVLEKIGPLTALEHVYTRAAQSGGIPYVLTPDEAIERFCDRKTFNVLRHDGPEEDVLARYMALADMVRPDAVVRLTADCPFVQPADIGMVVGAMALTGVHYASNVERGEREHTPDGYDVEAFTTDELRMAFAAAEGPDREHVTTWMRERSPWTWARTTTGLGSHRWTLDTPDDLAWFREVAERIDVTPPHPTVHDLLRLIRDEPAMERAA